MGRKRSVNRDDSAAAVLRPKKDWDTFSFVALPVTNKSSSSAVSSVVRTQKDNSSEVQKVHRTVRVRMFLFFLRYLFMAKDKIAPPTSRVLCGSLY
jgi:hypothetical protein